MALMRDRPIVDVVDKLDLALPGHGKREPVARSAVAQARARLGDAPMEWLFLRSADAWGHASADTHRWRELALYGVDGSTLRVPDSDENRDHFGGQSAGEAGRGPSAYPLVRLAALMALRSHLLVGVSFGPYDNSEYVYASDLWSCVPDNALVVVDRGFFAAGVLIPLARDGQNRHWLIRAKTNNRWRVIQSLGPGDDIVELNVSSVARGKDPSLPKTWRVRAITYQRKGYQPQTLLTSLLDAQAYPAEEIVQLYHERWEIELGYDELKTELLDREEAIRSLTVRGVKQELWGPLPDLQPGAARDGADRRRGRGGPRPDQLRDGAALHPRRVVLAVRDPKSRCDPEAPAGHAREHQALHLALATAEPRLPSRGENQDEQLPPKPSTARW
jgi:hypothetical protein